jgi:hypothetical protein
VLLIEKEARRQQTSELDAQDALDTLLALRTLLTLLTRSSRSAPEKRRAYYNAFAEKGS